MSYSPFQKQLNEIKESDLNTLIHNQIPEGWYIEYKSQIPSGQKPDNKKISKSVASFANTNGGWIFWGISADDKNIPTDINGIDLSNFNNFEDQIAQIINSNISPKPLYQFKQVKLQNDKTVFIIKVEESPLPPYINCEGIIYQRENNISSPIRERYIIEKLNDKANQYIQRIEEFCTHELVGTKGQSDANTSFLELYFFPLPFDDFIFKNFRSSVFFNEVAANFYQGAKFSMNIEDEESFVAHVGLKFNSIYSSTESIIIRPLTDNNFIYKTTTVELFQNGNLKFTIPLQIFQADDAPDKYAQSSVLKYLIDTFSPYETVEDYDNLDFLLSKEKKYVDKPSNADFVNYAGFIDGSELILSIMIVMSCYKQILISNGFDIDREFGYRARVTNTWRKFIFFDSEDYLKNIKLYNIPLSPKDDIEIPSFSNGNAFISDLKTDYFSFGIAKDIIEGIGLPNSQEMDYFKIITNTLARFKI